MCRQPDRKGRAVIQLTVHLNLSVMQIDDFLDNRQTQAGTGHIGVVRVPPSVETFKNIR